MSTPVTDIVGLYSSRLPAPKPTLADLVDRAMAASDAFVRFASRSDGEQMEWLRLGSAVFDARADLRAALMNMGLSKRQIDKLGEVL